MEWWDCKQVERVPGKVSGAWVLRNTRLAADAVVENFDAGESVADIVALFEVTAAQVLAVLVYAQRVHVSHPARQKRARSATSGAART